MPHSAAAEPCAAAGHRRAPRRLSGYAGARRRLGGTASRTLPGLEVAPLPRDSLRMDQISHNPGPRRVGPVEPDLLASAVFLYAEYLRGLEAGAGEEADDEGPEVETRAVLDLLTEELGSDVATTLNLFMRVTALQRLLTLSPPLARLAIDDDTGGLRETALVAAARLDLHVQRAGSEGVAEFNVREFREALEDG